MEGSIPRRVSIQVIDEFEIVNVELGKNAGLIWMVLEEEGQLLLKAVQVIDACQGIGLGNLTEMLLVLIEDEDRIAETCYQKEDDETCPLYNSAERIGRPGIVWHQLQLPEISTEHKPVRYWIDELLLRAGAFQRAAIPWGAGL